MTKSEAIRCIAALSSGTIAHYIGNPTYKVIDAFWSDAIIAIDACADNAFKNCATWGDVLNVIGK